MRTRRWLGLVAVFLITLAVLTRTAAADDEDEDDDDTSEDYSLVTYGSALRFRHISSSYHLHSHGINYGSGSGQQSVTAVNQDDDSNSLWQVKERYNSDTIPIGTPVRCGDAIRLQHVGTRRYLHSHLHTSPLTNKQEVSGYGEGSHSDTGDNWRVDCSGQAVGATLSLKPPLPSFSLYHFDTGKRLYSRRADEFNQQNCRGCPIVGQLEVSCANAATTDSAAQWSVGSSGILFPVKHTSQATAE